MASKRSQGGARRSNGVAGQSPRASFLAGAGSIEALPSKDVAPLIAAASDIALVLDAHGVMSVTKSPVAPHH